eukprot:14840410-Alexandrium_andersonii.AAC.1
MHAWTGAWSFRICTSHAIARIASADAPARKRAFACTVYMWTYGCASLRRQRIARRMDRCICFARSAARVFCSLVGGQRARVAAAGGTCSTAGHI